MVLKPGMTRF